MPDIGLSRPYIALHNFDGTQETYTEGKRMGRAANVDINPNTSDSSNDGYYDNEVGETDGGTFTNGDLTMTVGEIETAIAKMAFGVKTEVLSVNGTQVTMRVYTDAPDAPDLGFGVIVKQQVENQVRWQPIVLPKISFRPPQKTVETQGETLNYQNTAVPGRIMRSDVADAEGKRPWMKDALVATEALADAFIRTLLGMPIQDVGTLTLVSVPGSESGTTDIAVSPSIESGNHYMYKLGSSLTLPYYDQTCGTEEGFTAWDGVSAITAAGGKILVVETDDADNAKKAGIAAVNAVEALSGLAQYILSPDEED